MGPQDLTTETTTTTTTTTVLVTGGAGYVGSHCVLELLQAGCYQVLVIDNLVSSQQQVINISNNNSRPLPECLARVEKLASGRKIARFYRGSVGDSQLLEEIFSSYSIDVVMHFAALKAVAESVTKPLTYYANNVAQTVTLLETMAKYNVKKLIFSSSATVYGVPKYLPLDEQHPADSLQSCTSPYGRGKVMVEQILSDLATSDCSWSIISLRYFNPVGAHPSGLIGEDQHHAKAMPPNNLMPFIAQVASGQREYLTVFGDDYEETVDGTPVRDYLHITDLAAGHMAALKKLLEVRGTSDKLGSDDWSGFTALNLGTGTGSSVLQVVAAFEAATGVQSPVPCKIVDRRPGDVPVLFADASLAEARLGGWTAKLSLQAMCSSAWNWQRQNPKGYAVCSSGGAQNGSNEAIL